MWRLGISSPGAVSLTVVFSHFEVPAGARVYVWTADHLERTVAFTQADEQPSGELSAPPLAGDHVIVEADLPAGAPGALDITVGLVGRGFETVAQALGAPDPSAPCEINVGCPLVNQLFPGIAADDARAVALIVKDGSALCTGTMLNDTANDGRQFMLTANHCGSPDGTWTAVFNYQDEFCNQRVDPTIVESVSGIVSDASSSNTDFDLTQINQPIPPWFNVFLAGWNAAKVAYDADSFGISHPAGAPSKFLASDAALGQNDFNGLGTNNWWVQQPEYGITEPGSSGSALFDETGHVLGDLTGGFSSCGVVGGPDFYAKFAQSWDYLGSPNQQLEYWLDPHGVLDGLPGGEQEWDGMDLSTHRQVHPGLADLWLSVQGDRPVSVGIEVRVTSQSAVYEGTVDNVWVAPGTLASSTEVRIPLTEVGTAHPAAFQSDIQVRTTYGGPAVVTFWYGEPEPPNYIQQSNPPVFNDNGSSQYMVSNFATPFFFGPDDVLNPTTSPDTPASTVLDVDGRNRSLGSWSFVP